MPVARSYGAAMPSYHCTVGRIGVPMMCGLHSKLGLSRSPDVGTWRGARIHSLSPTNPWLGSSVKVHTRASALFNAICTARTVYGEVHTLPYPAQDGLIRPDGLM